MLTSLCYAFLGTAFTCTMTALGAGTVFFLPARRGEQKPLLGFAAGVMTAASVWSLLLPSIDRAEAMGLLPWLPGAAGMALGAIFLLVLEHCIAGEQGELLTAAITLHNIPEGMAVGLAFALSAQGEALSGAVALALGVGLQNFPEGAAVSLPLAHRGRGKAFLTGLGSGIVEPLFGVGAVVIASLAAPLMPWLLGFAAGAMLYVVAQELVPQAQSRGGTVGYLVGFGVMMVMDVALG